MYRSALYLFGLAAALATPAFALAGDDDDCDEAIVSIDVDVASGEATAYRVDGSSTVCSSENCTWTSTTSVTLQFSTLDWDVLVNPAKGRAWSQSTVRGATYVRMKAAAGAHALTFEPQGPETPVVPDIILQPDKNCPPPT